MHATRFISALLTVFLMVSFPASSYAADKKDSNGKDVYEDELDEFRSVGIGLLLQDGQEILLEGMEDNSEILRADKVSANNAAVAQELNAAFKLYEDKDFKKAFEKFIGIARIGEVKAQRMVGVMYGSAQGTEKDDKQAFRWFEKAAKNFDPLSMHHIGVRYFTGTGTKRDISQAAMWLTLATEFYDLIGSTPTEQSRAKEDLNSVLARLSLKEQRLVQGSVKKWKTQNRAALKSFKKKKDNTGLQKENNQQKK